LIREFSAAIVITQSTPKASQISVFELKVRASGISDRLIPVITQKETYLAPGNLLDWSLGQPPFTKPIPADGTTIQAITDELKLVHQEAILTRKPGRPFNQSFDPPYTIVKLTPSGVKAVSPMPAVCNIR
jgi:hypothetical protein